MGMISEFKDFIAKGNAMDLAVGVIIGAAFGAIVNSLVAINVGNVNHQHVHANAANNFCLFPIDG